MMIRILFVMCLLLLSATAHAQMSQSYENGVLVCTVRADGTNDDDWIGDAVTACNAWSGPSKIILSAPVTELTTPHYLTSATSIMGATPACQLDVDGTGQFIFNNSFAPELLTSFDIADASAGDGRITVTSGTAPVKGDWIVLWSNDQVPVAPHAQMGDQQSPESLHLVNDVVATNTIYLKDNIPFDLTAAANAKGVIIPSSTWLKGITIDNLVLNWSGASPPGNYKVVFRFNACEGVTVTERVITTRDGPGAIAFDYCANSSCRIRINGSAADDGVYGMWVGPVNGILFDNIVKGTRHAFTTTSGQNLSTPGGWGAIDSVQTNPTNTITEAGHTLVDGGQVSITGTAPGGLQTGTNYWVVNATTDTIQLAATPGGTPITLTSAGSASLRRVARFGTPINCEFRGIYYNQPKWGTGSSITRQVWDTHAEGKGLLVNGVKFILNGHGSSATQYAASSRCVGTVFKDCTFEGGLGPNVGIRIMGSDTIVDNCVFNGNLWRGVLVNRAYTGALDPDNVVVSNCTFNDTYAHCIRFSYGDNHKAIGNKFWGSSNTQGGSPFFSKSYIDFLEGTGHVVQSNMMQKDINDTGIDTYQLATSDLTVTGNNMTGYGAGVAGFGRILPVASWDDGTNDYINFTTSHGWVSNDQIQFVGSPLPTGITVGTVYYVIYVDQDTIQVSASAGPGSKVDWTGAVGTGASAQNANVDDFETAYRDLNTIDERAALTAADADATPSVLNAWKLTTANTGATTITDFDDGVDNQKITVIIDGNTTVQDNANIQLEGGTNFVDAQGGSIVLLNVSGVWNELSRVGF